MPRQAGVTVENKFTQGLVTEVTGVTSPENSVTETENMIYDRRGRASRRLGLEYEDGFAAVDLSLSTNMSGVLAEYLWETVSNISAISFIVVQVANKLLFFAAAEGLVPSANKKSFEVNLIDFKVPVWTDGQVINQQASLAAGNGKLFVTHSYCEPFYITYDADTDTISTSTINVQARDFEGVKDNLGISERPLTLSALHKYNLWNQGWSQKIMAGLITTTGQRSVPTLALVAWQNDGVTTRADFPGNQDVWWYYKGVVPGTQNRVEKDDVFIIDQISKIAVGNTPAPKGHYIYNAWDTSRNAQTDESRAGLGGTVPETSSNGARPSVVAFYYGRVFYAGVRKDTFSSNIYFSQIIERDEQYGFCYQQNDPTSEQIFDLLSSDGGVIKIPDIVNVIDMRVFGPSLYIFASNGVWSVTGSNNSSFKATDYQVQKVSPFPALGKNSIVDVGGTPVWWNGDAIYALGKEDVSQQDAAQNLTIQTIQTIYDAIPSTSKINAKGAFNQLDSLVHWLFRQSPEVEVGDSTRYDSVLVLDTVTKGFYTFRVPDSALFLSGLLPVSNAENHKVFKFLTTGEISGVSDGFTFSEFRNPVRTDWESELGGVDWESYFITGYRVRGELLKKFQTNYLTVILENDELSSAYAQGIWDYTNSNLNGRFTNPQQVYRTNNYYAGYQRSKVKIRGQGYSLQFKFYSDGRLPFTIIGWAGFETSNAIP